MAGSRVPGQCIHSAWLLAGGTLPNDYLLKRLKSVMGWRYFKACSRAAAAACHLQVGRPAPGSWGALPGDFTSIGFSRRGLAHGYPSKA